MIELKVLVSKGDFGLFFVVYFERYLIYLWWLIIIWIL